MSRQNPGGAAVSTVALLAAVGVLAYAALIVVNVIVVIWALFKWPWFHPAPQLVLPATEPGLSPTSMAVLGLMLAAIVVRAVRAGAAGTSAGTEVAKDVVGVLVSAALSYTILGSASVWWFNLVQGWGVVPLVILALFNFLSGWAPGFMPNNSVFAGIYFHHPALVLWTALPTAVGDLLDALVRKDTFAADEAK